ncbi:unnamed protein product, partial [marine sediment metagenome]
RIMAERTPGEKRAEFIARARIAIREGQSQAQFLRLARTEKFSIRRTQMISDWHSVGETEKKADLFKYVRKDYYPTAKSIAHVEWDLSQEFMYKVKVQSRIAPGEPLTERFVNIMQDRPLTPGEVEALAWEMIQEQSPKIASQVVSLTGWTVVQRVS